MTFAGHGLENLSAAGKELLPDDGPAPKGFTRNHCYFSGGRMVRDARRRAPHHEGLKTSSFRSIAKRCVSKDEAIEVEIALAAAHPVQKEIHRLADPFFDLVRGGPDAKRCKPQIAVNDQADELLGGSLKIIDAQQ